jgi:WD40 repeat protein
MDGRPLRTSLHFFNAISSCGKWAAILVKRKLSLFSTTDGTSLWSTAVQGCSFLSFSPEGEVLASVSEDNTILFFSVRSGELEGQFKAETPLVLQQVSFSPLPSRHILVSAATRGEWATKWVAVYSVPDGELLWDCTEDSFCRAAYLSSGGVVIVGANVEILGGQSGKPQSQARTESSKLRRFVSTSPDGTLIAFDRQRGVAIWSVAECREVEFLVPKEAEHFWSGCFSPDSSFFVGGSGEESDHAIRIWKCSTWTCVATLHGHFSPVSSVAFQSDGRIISASGGTGQWGGDGTIRIWDVSAVLEEREFRIEVEEGPPEVGDWFRQGIPLGGWVKDKPFVFKYPKFKLPEGVRLLDWQIGGASESEECGTDSKEVDNLDGLEVGA